MARELGGWAVAAAVARALEGVQLLVEELPAARVFARDGAESALVEMVKVCCLGSDDEIS